MVVVVLLLHRWVCGEFEFVGLLYGGAGLGDLFDFGL